MILKLFKFQRKSALFIFHSKCNISAYTIGHRKDEQRIKSVLSIKQHYRVI